MTEISVQDAVLLIPPEAGVFLAESCGYEQHIWRHELPTAVEKIFEYICRVEGITEDYCGQKYWVTEHSLVVLFEDSDSYAPDHAYGRGETSPIKTTRMF